MALAASLELPLRRRLAELEQSLETLQDLRFVVFFLGIVVVLFCDRESKYLSPRIAGFGFVRDWWGCPYFGL